MKITPSSLNTLAPHTSTLSVFLHDPSGGIVSDTVITGLGPDSYYFVTNAGTRDEDLKFISEERTQLLDAEGATDDSLDWRTLHHHSLLALQGPLAAQVLQRSVFVDEDDKEIDPNLSTLYFGNSRYLQLMLSDGTSTPALLVSRT